MLGAGSWGTTVAHLAAHNQPTMLWARRPEVAAEISESHTNERYLPEHELHEDLMATSDLAEAVSRADVLVVGVPTSGFRDALSAAAEFLRPWVPVVSLSKGFERDTQLRMSEVISEEMPGHPVAILTGPNLAKEILAGDAAAAVVATEDPAIAQTLQQVFSTDLFRVYTNDDVIGCELGGALKNVIALASGMADGLGTGDNTRAAVITRGLAELTQLGVAMGGRPESFAGLAGMGDLLATCLSTQSRNRHVGEELGKGKSIDQIIEEMDQVAEGVKTCAIVKELGAEYGVPVPITYEIYRVCHEGGSPYDAYRGLLNRDITSE